MRGDEECGTEMERKGARIQQLVLWKVGPVLFIMLILSVAVLYIITNGTERRAVVPPARTPLVERQFAEETVAPHTGLLTHSAEREGVGHTINTRSFGRNGEQPEDGATETTANPEDLQHQSTESKHVMRRSTSRTKEVEKTTTTRLGTNGHLENNGTSKRRSHRHKERFDELKRRQNVSTNANDASTVAATALGQSSSSDAFSPEVTNEPDEEADDSHVHADESTPDDSSVSEVPTAAGVSESTESSIETSQSPQFPLAFDPDEIAGVVPDEAGPSASEQTAPPPQSDVTAKNDPQGGGVVEQRDLVSVSSDSADEFNGNHTGCPVDGRGFVDVTVSRLRHSGSGKRFRQWRGHARHFGRAV
ncbi:hypothetical protein MTO96_008570 [Rhipicephalus appendiculatus]